MDGQRRAVFFIDDVVIMKEVELPAERPAVDEEEPTGKSGLEICGPSGKEAEYLTQAVCKALGKDKKDGGYASSDQMKRLSTLEVLYEMQSQDEDLVPNGCTNGVLHPHAVFRLRFDVLIAICLAYNCALVPYRACFGVLLSPSDPMFWFDRMVDLVFTADVIINFVTGYVSPKGEIVLERKAIVRNYLSTWFVMDLIASVPYEIFVLLASPEGGDGTFKTPQLARTTKSLRLAKILRGMKLLKLFRLVRVLGVMQRVSKAVSIRHSTASIIKVSFSHM